MRVSFAFFAVALPLIALPAYAADDIVVTGKPLSAFEDDLADCLARSCPPDEEAAAAVRLAEARLRSGDYPGSMKAIDRTISRTKEQASKYPNAIAALYDARSTLALHDGDRGKAVTLSFKSYRTQQDFGHPGALGPHTSRLVLIDTLTRLGKVAAAKSQIRVGKRAAEDDGLSDMVLGYDIRASIIDAQTGNSKRALSDLKALLARPEAQTSPARRAALGVIVQIAPFVKDETSAKQAAAELAAMPVTSPVLIGSAKGYAPANAGDLTDTVISKRPNQARAEDSYGLKWADVRYTISPAGQAENLEVSQSSGGDQSWLKPVLFAIASRQFAPPGDPPHYNPDRQERYTWSAEMIIPTGSMIKRRAGKAAIERLDLTVEPSR